MSEGLSETAVLFQGVTMDFRTVFAESEYVQNAVQHLQNVWRERGICGIDIAQVCSKQNYLDEEKTWYEQPAIFTVSLAKLWELEKTCRAELFLGHSFGEYAASCASGAITPEDGLRITQFRGQLAYEVNLAHPGLMAAISGKLHMPSIYKICATYGVDIANINSPEQIVISGEFSPVEKACEEIEREGLKVSYLKTGCPFHSRYFAPKQKVFRQFLDTIQFRRPRRKLLMNATARLESDPERIKDCLVAQLTNPVNFPRVVQSMQALGADPEKTMEIGGRNILKGFVKRILRRP